MKPLLLIAATSTLALATPVAAQSMDHANMPGMKMPAKPAAAKPKPATARPKARPATRATARPAPQRATPARRPAAPAAQAADPACSPEHAKMGHCTPAQAAPASPPPTDPHAGHDMPPPPVGQRAGGAQDPTPKPSGSADPHAGHDMSAMPGTDASAMQGGAMTGHGTLGTALPAGSAPAPAAPEPTYADRIWGREAMIPARRELRREHGGSLTSMVIFNLAEYQVRDGRDGFRWDGEGWFGGDINRLVVKSEGSGNFGEGVDDAEIQALYSRTIGPYFNFQAGVRYDFKPNPSRTYATIGIEGLAPYWFEVEGALFLSNKGDLLARFEGYYDQRITQRLILQPRAELNLAAQDVPENGIGAGVSDIELGLRLRYEIKRELAPYVGISYDRKLGDTARFARLTSEDVEATSLVLGVRVWF